jgi:hypothetical protein
MESASATTYSSRNERLYPIRRERQIAQPLAGRMRDRIREPFTVS